MTRPLSVGFIGPFPPTRSGIADYDSEIFSSLSKNSSLSLVSYEPRAARDALSAAHDVLLFQIGNDPMHAPSVEALFAPERTTPAVVVLHEFVLHHLFAAAYLTRGREDDYARELERAHGARGRAFAESRSAGPLFPVWDLDPWAFPMSAGVIAAAEAVVAHSLLVTGAVLKEVPGARAITIPQHVVRAARTPAPEARRALGLPLERPIGITLGIVSPAKRIAKILEALALLPPERRPFFFVGGAVSEDDPLRGFVRENGLAGDVTFGGYLSEEDYWKAASAATFAVNLRHPTMGETSHAVCRLAGIGLPLIVSATGWFRELPDTFADLIPIGGDEVGELARAIERLSFNPELARTRGVAAASWAEPRNPDTIARAYVEVFEEVVAGRSPSRAVSGRLALALEELGVARAGIHGAVSRDADGVFLAEVARRSEGILPGAAPARIP